MANEVSRGSFQDLIVSLSPLQYQIIRILDNNGPMTRNEILRELKSARTTIYDNLVRLERLEILKIFTYNNGMIGRPLVYWQLA